MKSILKIRGYIFLVAIMMLSGNIISAQTVKTVGAGADYTNLKAAFDAINAGSITGNIELQITTNITETVSAVLYQSGFTGSGLGTSNYATINIYPTSSGLTISGDLEAPLIDLNGANYVTFDGRVYNSGSKDLTINNINTSAGTTSTIRFINSASNNTIKFLTIKGAETDASSGVIYFSTFSSSTGNNNNIIENNNITSSSDSDRPVNALFSNGPSYSRDNTNLTIRNNDFFNYFNKNIASNGIYLSENTTNCSITENHFYETTSFAPLGSVGYIAIKIDVSSGKNFTITGNYIGGSSASCNGTWTKTGEFNNTFTGIYLNHSFGLDIYSNIDGNIIKNFDWTNSTNGSWTGISVNYGDVRIGANSGNIIGSATETNSVNYTATTTGGAVYGMYFTNNSSAVVCSNNTIGSISANNSPELSSNIYGIYKSGNGAITISSNIIGSTTTPNSINSTSASTNYGQSIVGIYNFGSGTVNILNNIVANLKNSTSNSNIATQSRICGIISGSGTASINGNQVYNLSISNANTNYYSSSVTGISLTASSTANTVSDNTIFNLTNTNDNFAGYIYGIFFYGGSYANIIKNNFIHSLSASGATSNSAQISGINTNYGTANCYNNIIRLGGITKSTLYGIYNSASCNHYFNTVYIDGTVAAGSTNKSYCLYSNTTNVRNFSNNNLFNARSTAGGVSLHYAIGVNSVTGLTINNNNYYSTGTGAVLGSIATVDKADLPMWRAATNQDNSSKNINPLLTNAGSLLAPDYKPASPVLYGTPIAGLSTDYSGNPRLGTPTIGALEGNLTGFIIDIYKTGVLQGSFVSLKGAFDAINAGVYTGALEVRINASSTEQSSAILNKSGTGSANYSSIIIFPTISGIIVSGDFAAPLIDFNGVGAVTIDGRVNATGITKDMTIINTSATGGNTSTIRYYGNASSNILKYCIIKGSQTNFYAGVVFFGSTISGYGNYNNRVEYNDITNAGNSNRPVNAVFSFPTSQSYYTSSLNISNNNIYDFQNSATNSSGIYLYDYNTNAIISGNSFYETTSIQPSNGGIAVADCYAIQIYSTTGYGFTVTNNYIGGSSVQCGGLPWRKSNEFNNSFYAVKLFTSSGSSSTVQGNTITNFDWNNPGTGDLVGFYLSGYINVGNVTGNIIGKSTGTGAINTTGTNVWGINTNSGSGNMSIQNNSFGSINSTNSSTSAASIYGIYAKNPGYISIQNNLFGSVSTANSIYAASSSTDDIQNVYGIYLNGNATGTNIISGNTIANLNNGTTNSSTSTLGSIYGIATLAGTNTINNNTIYNLTIGNANSATDHTNSVGGIVITNTGYVNTVTGNTIYNLTNKNESFAGQITGIYFNGSTGANVVTKNFIQSLTATGVSATATVNGIKAVSGATTYSNNIVNIGDNTANIFYGIYETGLASQTCNLYFNTIYVGGTPTTGSLNSFALYSNANSNIRNYRNNIFHNARSNGVSASGKQFAAYFNYATPGSLTLDYNNYFVNVNGGILAYYNSTDITGLSAIQSIIGQNAKSKAVDPLFALAGGTSPLNYLPSYNRLKGIGGTGITTDYANLPRFITQPAMGALEYGAENFNKQLSVKVYLQGLWNPTNNNMNTCKVVGGVTPKFSGTVVDTVFLELHNTSNYATLVHKIHGLELHQDGTINSPGLSYINLPDTYSGSYYVTVRTRNHLPTTSASGVSFSPDAPVYDFTTAATQAFGSNMKQLATGIYGFYAGDVTQDGLIDPLTDFALVKSAINSYAEGYHVCDLNGDGLIDPLTDFATVKAQINAYIKAILP